MVFRQKSTVARGKLRPVSRIRNYTITVLTNETIIPYTTVTRNPSTRLPCRGRRPANLITCRIAGRAEGHYDEANWTGGYTPDINRRLIDERKVLLVRSLDGT